MNTPETENTSTDWGKVGAMIALVFGIVAAGVSVWAAVHDQLSPWATIALAAFFGSAIFWVIALFDAEREKRLKWLKEQRIGKQYRDFLSNFLKKIDGLLSKGIDRQQHPIAFFWSADLLGLTLLLAIAYPLLSMNVQWLVGDAAMLGTVQVFQPLAYLWERIVLAGMLLLALLLLFQSRNKTDGIRWLLSIGMVLLLIGVITVGLTTDWGILVFSLLGIVVFYVVFAFSDFLIDKVGLSDNWAGSLVFMIVAVAVAVAVAVTVAGTAVFSVFSAVVVAVAVAAGGGVAIVVIVAVVVVGVATAAGAVAGADGVVSGALAGAGVVSFVSFVFFEKYFQNSKPLRLFGVVGILISLLIVVTLFTLIVADFTRTFLVFLGFLPLMNALFDYLSIGLTRYLLRRSISAKQTWVWGLVDLAGAALLFLGLKLSLVALLVMLHDASGTPLLPMLGENGLFTAIKQQPYDYIWLYIILFSTLIPTLLHLNLACFSLVATRSRLLQNAMQWIAQTLRNVHMNYVKTTCAFLLLTTLTTLFLVVPMAVLSHVWQALIGNHVDLLAASLSIAERWAEYIVQLRS